MRPPNPGDETDDWITALRDGDDSDLHSDEDDELAYQEEQDLEKLRQETAEVVEEQSESPQSSAPAPKLPAVLQRIFGSDAEDELMAVAHFLDPKAKKDLTLVFHTDIGDVKLPINWCSTEPDKLHRTRNLLLVMVRSNSSMFVPKSGAEIDVSVVDQSGRQSPPLSVICLCEPMRLYPKVAVDLLCFLPQTKSDVEKTGKLKDNAPSTVSGKPSTHTDAAGEPIADGEKSAAVKELPKAEDAEKEDFDKPRGS